MLIRHDTSQRTEYTALTVLDGFESSMTESYIRARAAGWPIDRDVPRSDGGPS